MKQPERVKMTALKSFPLKDSAGYRRVEAGAAYETDQSLVAFHEKTGRGSPVETKQKDKK